MKIKKRWTAGILAAVQLASCFSFQSARAEEQKADVYNVFNGNMEQKVFVGRYKKYWETETVTDDILSNLETYRNKDFEKPGYSYLKSDYYEGSIYHYFFDFDTYQLEHHVRYRVVDQKGNPVEDVSLFGEKTDDQGFIATEDDFVWEREVSNCGTLQRDPMTGQYSYDELNHARRGTFYLNGNTGDGTVTHGLMADEVEHYPDLSNIFCVSIRFQVKRKNNDTIAPYAEYQGTISKSITKCQIVEVDEKNSIVQLAFDGKGASSDTADPESEDGQTTRTKENPDGSTETIVTKEKPDGEKLIQTTKIYPNGKKELSSEKRNADGTKKSSVVSISSKGKVTGIVTSEKTKTGETTIPYDVKSGNSVIMKKIRTTEKKLVIPGTIKPANGKSYRVTGVGNGAMKSNNSVVKLVMGGNIRTIGKRSFQSCPRLKKVKFSKKVASVSEYAFYGCKKLTSISLPSSTRNIGKGCFKNCRKMKKFVLGKTKKGSFENEDGQAAWGAAIQVKIGASALENCINLKEVVIDSQVQKIGNEVFKNCKKLARIIIYSTILKVVGKKALTGVHDCKIKVPVIKLRPYKVLLKNKGQGKKVIVAKL